MFEWISTLRKGFVSSRTSKQSLELPFTDTLTEPGFEKPQLSIEAQRQFLRSCWNYELDDTLWADQIAPFKRYFDHYAEHCDKIPDELKLPEYTHQTFCDIVKILSRDNDRDTSVNNIKAAIRLKQNVNPTASEDNTVQVATDFVSRAILLIDCSLWQHKEELSAFFARKIAGISSQPDRYRIPLSFNARNFSQKANIKIVWEPDLLVHLDHGLRGTNFTLFHHVTALELYKNSKSPMFDIFPPGFISETQRTIWLMLPPIDSACMKWLRTEHGMHGLDLQPGNCINLTADERNIQSFHFWRDRLITARDNYEISKPNNLLQFWRDDRNLVQWYTLWVAMIVFVLTVLGLVASILQVYKAFSPG